MGSDSWVLEDPVCCGPAKPECHNYGGLHALRAGDPQQEKPLQGEAHEPQPESTLARATRESPSAAGKTQYSRKLNKKSKVF